MGGQVGASGRLTAESGEPSGRTGFWKVVTTALGVAVVTALLGLPFLVTVASGPLAGLAILMLEVGAISYFQRSD